MQSEATGNYPVASCSAHERYLVDAPLRGCLFLPALFCVLRLCHALKELKGLLKLGVEMVGLQGLAHAAFDVRAHDLLVGAFEERLRGENLIGNVHAVAVIVDHLQNAVELAARDLELAAHGIVIGSHGPQRTERAS